MQRILLKISGESLANDSWFAIDPDKMKRLSSIISEVKKTWTQLAIVIWWWNIYRWASLIENWVDGSDSHNMSMLSTVFNWVVLKNFLEKIWINSIVLDPLGIKFLENYNKDNAIKYLTEWKVVILVWGTGNPYFTTDSWWVLRSIELRCDMMIKATSVDWVYDKDPQVNRDAKFFEEITYDEIINKNLRIMDQTAIAMARDNHLEIVVVNITKPWSIQRATKREKEWTIIKSS